MSFYVASPWLVLASVPQSGLGRSMGNILLNKEGLLTVFSQPPDGPGPIALALRLLGC